MAPFRMIWEAPEYEYREKGSAWYWSSIIVAALCVAFAVWQRNFLFGFFVVVAEILFIVWGNRAPRMVSFALTETSFMIDNEKSRLLKEFESMSIEPLGTDWSEVIFTFHAKLKPPLRVLLPEDRIAEFRDRMKLLIKEVPYEPTFLDAIEKLFRF